MKEWTMNQDFHYYGTYCAASLAGYSSEESRAIAYSAAFVDHCSKALLTGIGAPREAATTQLQLEMMDAGTDLLSLQNITRIWASFHFLPGNLYAQRRGSGKRYLQKYRLICNPNGELAAATVELAKGGSLQAAGLAMHVLADTWAHRYFAGTPSLVINNTTDHFYELVPEGDGFVERKIQFVHTPTAVDNPALSHYVGTVYQAYENSVMNLGHGRAGHLPDYSWIRYKYLPAWGGYREILKDNPSDYMYAFRQMVYALRYLRGEYTSFETRRYDTERVDPYAQEISAIIGKRQLSALLDWKLFGEKISGGWMPAFDVGEHEKEYTAAKPDEKNDTFLGRFILAALAQKGMVTGHIFRSGNLLAGFAMDFRKKDFRKKGFRGIFDSGERMEEKGKK